MILAFFKNGRTLRRDGTLLPKCAALIASAAALQLLGFVFRIAINRLAGTQAMALYQLIMSAYSVLMAVSLQGVILGVSRQSAGYLAKNNKAAVFRLRRYGRLLFLSLFALVALPTLLFSPFVAERLLGDRRTEAGLLLLLLCILLTGFENLNKAVFLGAQKVRPANISEVGELCIRILSVFLLLSLFKPAKPGDAAALIVLAMILSECFSVLFLEGCFLKIFGRKRQLPKTKFPEPPERQLRANLRKTALPVCGSSLLNKLLFSLNNILIPTMLMAGGATKSQALDAFALLFSMAAPLAVLPSCLIIPVAGLVLPKLSADLATNNAKDCLRKSAKLLQLVGLAALPFHLFLSFFAAPCCTLLYGSDAAAVYLPLLALATLLEYYEIASANLLNGLGCTFPAAASIVAEGLVLLLGTLLFVPALGLTGFCLGKLASTLVAAAINLIALKRRIPLRFRLVNWVGRPLLAALFALPLTLFFFHLAASVPLVFSFCFAVLFYFVQYSLFLRLLGTRWQDYLTTHFWAEKR